MEILWFIGMLFSFGIYVTTEEKEEKENWGQAIMIVVFLLFFWPTYLGCTIGLVLAERKKEDKVITPAETTP